MEEELLRCVSPCENVLPVFVQVAEVDQVLVPHLGDKHEIQCVTDSKVRSSVSLSICYSVLELGPTTAITPDS